MNVKIEPGTENYFTYRDLTIIQNLGEGSFGSVIVGRLHQCYDSFVAVRKIPNNVGNEDDFVHEFTKFGRIFHSRFVRYLGYFSSHKYFNLVMEFAAEGSLEDEIKLRYAKATYWSNDDIINLFVDMLIAVQYLHQQGIVHRNLKPSNFLFQTATYRLKLADIGMTDIMDRTGYSGAYTKFRAKCYTAPELLIEKVYDEKADVWSLGVILYEMCDLCHPFSDRFLTQTLPFMHHYPKGINELTRAMLIRAPEKRISIDELTENEHVKYMYKFYNFLA